MHIRTYLAPLGALGALLQAQGAGALGLGDLTMQSFLNEPLRAELVLFDARELGPDEIIVRLAQPDDFERLGVERSYFLTGVSFDVQLDDSGRGVVTLTTEQPVLEPFLDLVIEARWPSGRVLREYTVLVDPPAFREEVVVSVSGSEAVRQAEAVAAPPPEPAAPGGAEPQVRVLPSELPPGAMPERQFSAETSDVPRPGTRYLVRRDETLWRIAREAAPEGVAVQQAMLEIQRLNPEAFIGGNINRIKAGYIIYLPGAGDISSDDLAQAIAEVREQNADWEERSAEPGVTTAARLRISGVGEDTVSGDGSAASGAGVGAGGGRSRDSAGPVGAGAAGGPDVDARLGELGSRLAEVERLLALRDERIAALEAELASARESAGARDPSSASAPGRPDPMALLEPERPESADDNALAAGPAAVEASEASGSPRSPDEPGKPTAVAPEPVAASEPAEPKTRPAQQPTEPASFLDDILASMQALGVYLYGALGALLLLLLGLLAWRRRRAPGEYQTLDDAVPGAVDEADDMFGPLETGSDDEVAAEEGAAATDAAVEGEGEEDDEAPAAVEGDEDALSATDALAEADIYIAYGRFSQAIDLLRASIAREPENTALRLKLIELFFDMGDAEQAMGELRALRELGDAAAIGKAETLLGITATGNGAAAGAASRGDDGSLDDPLAASDEPPRDEYGMIALPGDEPAAGVAAYGEAAEERAALADPDPTGVSGEEADEPVFDVGEDDAAMVEPRGGEALSTLGTAGSPGESDDFEPSPAVLPEEGEPGAGATGPASVDALADALDEDPLDAAAPVGDAVAAFDEPLELELDDEEALAMDDAAADARSDGEDEFADLSIDDDSGDEVSDFSNELRFDLALDEDTEDGDDQDNGNGNGELVIAEDADAMATKLDLAQAYIDMGDPDGARSIIDEVIAGGSDEQRQEAEALLARIDD